MAAGLALWGLVAPAAAQLSSADIAALRAQGEEEGWTFTVGENEATRRSLEELCGLVEPPDWRREGRFDPCTPSRDLPSAFDWREFGGCTPVRNQGGCGSCWAFATVGSLESNILIVDGVAVDLSEQWLVSCNGSGWGCDGGWWAHAYHEWRTDVCDGTGAVSEAYFPYVAYDSPCNCPYPHPYTIESWAFIGPEREVADTNAIKQAILEYGPVTAAMYADYTFSAYTGGVFNQGALMPPNHGVVLVGWDDSLGAEGAWRLRNGWGSFWGEDGYMWIEYGRSYVGYGACYIEYAGQGLTPGPAITQQPSGGEIQQGGVFLLSVEAEGLGPLHYAWERDGLSVGTDAGELLIENASAADEGTYRCHVSDFRGSTTSQGAEMHLAPEAETPAAPPLTVLLLASLLALSAGLILRRRSA